MKKLFTVLFLAGVLAACDELPKDEILDLDIPEVKLSYDDLTESRSVSFYAREAWEVAVADKTRASSWLSVTPAEGPAGNATLTVAITEANNGTEPRSAVVTVKAGTATKSFTVTQHSQSSQNPDDPKPDPNKSVQGLESLYTYESMAQTKNIAVKSNFKFSTKVQYAQGDPGKWLDVKVESSDMDHIVTLNIGQNSQPTARTATLRFTDDRGAVYATTSITQKAASGEVAALVVTTDTEITSKAPGGMFPLKATSGAPIEVVIIGEETASEWFGVVEADSSNPSGPDGKGGYFINKYLVVDSNYTGEIRNVIVSVQSMTTRDERVQILIDQQKSTSDDYMTDDDRIKVIGPANMRFSADYQEIIVYVSSSLSPYGFQSGISWPAWCQYSGKVTDSRTGYDIHKWNLQKNTGNNPNFLSFSFQYITSSETITSVPVSFSQEAAGGGTTPEPELFVYEGEDNLEFPIGGGTREVVVKTASTSTTITCSSQFQWVTPVCQRQSDGNIYKITVKATGSADGSVQKGSFTITGSAAGGKTKSVDVGVTTSR